MSLYRSIRRSRAAPPQESVSSGEQTLTWPDFSLLMKAGATKDRPENTLLFFFLAFFGVAFSPRYPKRSDVIYIDASIACPLHIISRETLGRVELFCTGGRTRGRIAMVGRDLCLTRNRKPRKPHPERWCSTRSNCVCVGVCVCACVDIYMCACVLCTCLMN